ncbi:hypothetical protein EVAR_96964_1 [Eumeta japonica]|uniref:Uncharacterized protein n=1 Tax=Eumeta variegata TaxID=151549 RepID=A0A4C1VDP2_EUMVA|nr:hypothetical protein EVAR_96964_1 [Eumeta japonica]
MLPVLEAARLRRTHPGRGRARCEITDETITIISTQAYRFESTLVINAKAKSLFEFRGGDVLTPGTSRSAYAFSGSRYGSHMVKDVTYNIVPMAVATRAAALPHALLPRRRGDWVMRVQVCDPKKLDHINICIGVNQKPFMTRPVYEISASGLKSEMKTGLKLRTALGLKTSVGSESESKTQLGSESKARPVLKLTPINIKCEKIHSMSMLTELRTLIMGKAPTRKGRTTSAGPASFILFYKPKEMARRTKIF